MSRGGMPFSYESVSDAQRDAIETVLQLMRAIIARSGTELYTPSDHQAAWDVKSGLEYLMAPLEWQTFTHTKGDYKRHDE